MPVGEHHQIGFDLDGLAEQGVVGLDDQAGAVLGDLGHLALGEKNARVLLHGLVEVFGHSRGAHVLIDDEGLAVRVVFAHVRRPA
ncbi:MAG: hypothetical protein MZU91_00670 [Desulfosudis oleivorans]|nr:hypothetical protein [Desulfosudis oleivorans]